MSSFLGSQLLAVEISCTTLCGDFLASYLLLSLTSKDGVQGLVFLYFPVLSPMFLLHNRYIKCPLVLIGDMDCVSTVKGRTPSQQKGRLEKMQIWDLVLVCGHKSLPENKIAGITKGADTEFRQAAVYLGKTVSKFWIRTFFKMRER